jgi:hypothetical protein
VALVVERERFADDAEVGRKPALPQAVAQHHDLGPVPDRFLGRKPSAKQRLYAKHLEEIGGDGNPAQPLRLTRPGQQVVTHAVEREVAGQRGQRFRALAQIQHMPHLRRLPRKPAGVAVADPDQPVRVGKRQGPEQQRIHDAEHGGAGADAEPGDENDKSGQPGVPPERPDGVAQILAETIECHR